MPEINTTNIGFEKQIWDAACVLRGNIDASEYKSVVLGLIFLKYISDRFEAKYQELLAEGDGFEEDIDEYTAENIFFVPENARWSVISSAAHTPEIGTVIDDAMRSIEKENKRLKDILPKNFARPELDKRRLGEVVAAHTPEIGTVIDDAMRSIEKENKRLKDILPKNFARPELDKRRLGEVVDLFTNIQMIEHGNSKDILGRTYEYCLSKFAEQEGKLAGEFYTPSCVVRTFTNIQMIEHGNSKDILGRTYEYCLSKFAEQEGKLAGEFYTPSCVVRTLVEVLQPYNGRVYDPCCGSGGMFVQSAKFVENHGGNINKISVFGQDSNPTVLQPYNGRVYDPCCGSGGMFVQSAKFVENHGGNINKISVFGQDSNPTTWKMAQMNLAIRGIEADLGKFNADTFFNDCHPQLKADFIMANPPFN